VTSKVQGPERLAALRREWDAAQRYERVLDVREFAQRCLEALEAGERERAGDARECGKCDGKGFYEIPLGAHHEKRPCLKCNGTGQLVASAPDGLRAAAEYERADNSIGFHLTTVLCDRCGRDWGSVFSVMHRAGALVGVCFRCADEIDTVRAALGSAPRGTPEGP